VIAHLRLRAPRRHRAADHSPWTGDELARMVGEVKAVRRRNGKKRERMRRILRRLPW
jgi:hypothetical protein